MIGKSCNYRGVQLPFFFQLFKDTNEAPQLELLQCLFVTYLSIGLQNEGIKDTRFLIGTLETIRSLYVKARISCHTFLYKAIQALHSAAKRLDDNDSETLCILIINFAIKIANMLDDSGNGRFLASWLYWKVHSKLGSSTISLLVNNSWEATQATYFRRFRNRFTRINLQEGYQGEVGYRSAY
jgi:hypothetical protein